MSFTLKDQETIRKIIREELERNARQAIQPPYQITTLPGGTITSKPPPAQPIYYGAGTCACMCHSKSTYIGDCFCRH